MVGDLLERGRAELARASFAPAPREAHLLLGFVLGLSEAQILARWDDEVPSAAGDRFQHLLARRVQGEPVAYLVGRREFFGRDFRVDERVLIPRPETEHLIEAALALPLPDSPRILDLGTGSGCLAATLAAELPAASLVAVDSSCAALELASHNLRALDVEDRVRLVAADLASSLRLDAFDAVVSNPPYIDPRERESLSVEVRDFEPHEALFAPDAGDSLIRRLVAELIGLRPGAFLLFEMGHLQSAGVRRILEGSDFSLERMIEDYRGIPRVAVARRR